MAAPPPPPVLFGTLFGGRGNFLSKLVTANAGGATLQRDAFQVRIYDALVRIKQELGIDELLLAITDAQSIASSKVELYLAKYQRAVEAAVGAADTEAVNYYTRTLTRDGTRSARNIEKLLALQWKGVYEVRMEDVNAQMPLAQQIVSKYMSNFSASAKPKMEEK